MVNINEIIKENARRNAALQQPYDPITGEGCCGERVHCGEWWLPARMLGEHPQCPSLPAMELNRLRIKYDFEFWAATCATIKDKTSSRNIRFRLNAPQRRLLAIMEGERLSGRPVRIILLKARQWGGSTLVQVYMAWIQIVIHKRWNSLICGHLKQTSYAIKRMYNTLLNNYPQEYLDEGVTLKFARFEGSSSVQWLQERDCLVVMGSSRSEDAVRGYDLAMAHLTEVAYWPASAMHHPEDVVRSVSGTVSLIPDTLVVYESTANGVGNFFHNEWLRAHTARGDKVPVFVPWHEIEIYRLPVEDPLALWQHLDDYERALWDEGRTLEMINWYHNKRREYATHSLMMAEFPSNDIEAFTGTGNGVFDSGAINAFACDVACAPITGNIEGDPLSDRNAQFYPSINGPFMIWKQPEPLASSGRYMVVVDVGGRSDKADFSVILVMDTHSNFAQQRPEVVAQWRGHIDHDMLAWKAAAVARYYRNALLVIESNTLECENCDCDAGEFILDTIGKHYPLLYRRAGGKPGFQTNRHTKPQAIYALIKAVRERSYVERDQLTINEMETFERKPNGKFEARQGCHDDLVMTRAIALAVMNETASRRRRTITHADKQSLISSSYPPINFHNT